MKNQVWGTKLFITKGFTDFCSKNVLLLTRNCFYYIDVYENGYFPTYCPHFFFYNSDLGTSGTITTKTKINIFWKQNFFKLGVPFLWTPFTWNFFPKIFRLLRQKVHYTYFFPHFSSLCLVWLSSFQPPGNFGQIWGGLREDRQQKIDSLTHRRLFTIFHLVQK